MSRVFHKLFYHVVWSTYLREPRITPEIEKVLFPFLENKAKRFQSRMLGFGGIEDHIHIAIRIPPSESVSDIIGKLKGSSTYFLNKELHILENFQWQRGFGVFSFAEYDLGRILSYVKNQKMHHRSGRLNVLLEDMGEGDEDPKSRLSRLGRKGL